LLAAQLVINLCLAAMATHARGRGYDRIRHRRPEQPGAQTPKMLLDVSNLTPLGAAVQALRSAARTCQPPSAGPAVKLPPSASARSRMLSGPAGPRCPRRAPRSSP